MSLSVWECVYFGIGFFVAMYAANEFWVNATRRRNGAVVLVFGIAMLAWPVFGFVYFLRAWLKR